MKKNRQLLLLLVFCCFIGSINAQNLVESTFIESQTKEFLSSEYGIDATYDVDLYKILYETPDIHGVLDTASGLLIVPSTIEDTYPLLCYQHGTVNGRLDVPSELEGGAELAILFGGLGYVVVAPDYLGLGEARGVHPYVHADTEASAAIDMLRAARDYGDQNNVLLNDQVFVTGYSQGGHAAMAAHRSMEQNFSSEFTVTASAPMSGPYSISEAMRDFTLGDDPYTFVGYIAWVALSYDEAYDIVDDLSDFFKPQYVPSVELFRDEQIDLLTLTISMIGLLNQGGQGINPKFTLRDNVRDIIINGEDHPIYNALKANDVYDWAPTAPTRLFYCSGDDQVTFQNSILAEETMNNNGAADLAAMNLGANLNHGGCVTPATEATIDFFAQFQEITTGVFDVEQDETLFSIQPNPVKETLFVDLDDAITNDFQLQLTDVNGRLILNRQTTNSSRLSVDLSALSPGVYFLNIIADQRLLTKKVIVDF